MSDSVKEAVVSVFTDMAKEKDVRKLQIAVKSSKIFKSDYLFVKVISSTHTGDEFTPDGDTFSTEEFELVHGPNQNMSNKAFNIPAKGPKVVIFTNQTNPPQGTVFVKDIAGLRENLSNAVKKYNDVFSGNYDAAGEVDTEAEEELL